MGIKNSEFRIKNWWTLFGLHAVAYRRAWFREQFEILNSRFEILQEMASPARLVFTPFVVVVGCKCFFAGAGGPTF